MMRSRERLLSSIARPGAVLAVGILLVGCTGSMGGVVGGQGGGPGGNGPGNNGGNGGTSGPKPPNGNCTDSVVLAPQRVVRLTLKQMANATGTLINGALTQTLVTQQGLDSAPNAFFPPLDSTREGTVIIASRYQQLDGMAVTASQYVTTNYAAVTKCTSTTDATCAQNYLLALAQKAYRRALDTREQGSLRQVFTEVMAAGGTVQEGVQFGVEAVLNAPQFLYRSEIGDASKATADGVPLTQSEIATELAF